ncbi:Uncharacterized protein TCM_008063 [Theobroma cacao]|uniref:Uncharacterized protein n=1 Tax=Theobroma cacao TaxID=3641 RepID=A0A061E340_THECC|nr:Uncharacterized protein TCM_008063 [Theobroma cacao]
MQKISYRNILMHNEQHLSKETDSEEGGEIVEDIESDDDDLKFMVTGLLKFYDRDVLMRIGNKLGRTLKVGRTTSHALRGKFTRIYVEIDLHKPLVPKIFIEKATKKDYEPTKYGPWMVAKKVYTRNSGGKTAMVDKAKAKVASKEEGPKTSLHSGYRFHLLDKEDTSLGEEEIVPETTD